jgi:ribosome-associated protein YbcJ (S4-like RNA binding protein)
MLGEVSQGGQSKQAVNGHISTPLGSVENNRMCKVLSSELWGFMSGHQEINNIQVNIQSPCLVYLYNLGFYPGLHITSHVAMTS